MNDEELIGAWLAWYAAGDAAESTIRLRKHHLARFAHAYRLREAAEADLVAWLTFSAGTAANSRRSMQASLRSFYKWAAARGHVPADPTTGLRGISEPEGMPNPISEFALARALANAGHCRLQHRAAEFVAQRQRRTSAGDGMRCLHRDRMWPVAVLVQVTAADAAVGHAHAKLAVSQRRLVDILQPQITRPMPP